MDMIDNPYTPNAGAEPQAVVGRDDQLASFDLLLGRLQRGMPEQSMIITGLRGVGKTVLLGRFRKKALEQRWIVLEIEAHKHDDSTFGREIAHKLRLALHEISPRARWGERLTNLAEALQNFELSLDPTGGMSLGVNMSKPSGPALELTLGLTELLIKLGEAAQDHERGVVLLLDEIQFLSKTQLEALIEALHKVVQRSLPITLVGAGLPQIAELAGDAKSYSERLFKFPHIGNLSEHDAREALATPASLRSVTYDPDALDHAVAITEGYPYFLQELGYAVWPIAQNQRITSTDIEEALPFYENKLDESFFKVRLQRATELQRAYMRAMAELGPEPQTAADVAEMMGRTSTNLAPVRAKLIEMGLLYTPQHGSAAFTVPQFDRFMMRAMPDLIVPPQRPRARRDGPTR